MKGGGRGTCMVQPRPDLGAHTAGRQAGGQADELGVRGEWQVGVEACMRAGTRCQGRAGRVASHPNTTQARPPTGHSSLSAEPHSELGIPAPLTTPKPALAKPHPAPTQLIHCGSRPCGTKFKPPPIHFAPIPLTLGVDVVRPGRTARLPEAPGLAIVKGVHLLG